MQTLTSRHERAASANSGIVNWFPVEELAPIAELESYRKEVYRPLYHIHKWWANRLGSVFRTILLASLQPQFEWQRFYDPERIPGAPVVLDPFMGSGTTLGEGVKLGCKVIGCDINPVAALQVRKALEPVSLIDLQRAYARLEARVCTTISACYRTVSARTAQPADILYTFWVMTARCDACDVTTKLFSRYVFASHAYPGRSPAVQVCCPQCWQIFEGMHGRSMETCPHCRHAFDPSDAPVRGSRFHCAGCGREASVARAVRSAGPPEYDMYAMLLLEADGTKSYQAISEADRERYTKAETELRANESLSGPHGEVHQGYNTQQILNYGIERWRDLFNARQLLCLGVLLKGIEQEPDEALREFMLLLFSGTLEFNNMLCSYKGEGTGAVRHAFSHHVLRPHRTPLEAHVWGTPKSSGSFSTLFQSRLLRAKRYCEHPFELRLDSRGKGEKVFLPGVRASCDLARSFEELQGGGAQALVLSRDSGSLPLPDRCVDVVVTDPPYFDNVNYSELADLFYSWLHPVLWGDAVGHTTRHSREVQSQDPRRFGELLGDVFAESVRVLKPGGLVVFTFHHSKAEAWHGLAAALKRADLTVLRTHAIKAEMSVAQPKQLAREPIDIDCVIVAARRSEAVQTTENPLLAAEAAVRSLNGVGFRLSRTDVKVVLAGEALRWANGEDVAFAILLERLWSSVEEVHAGQRLRPMPAVPPRLPLF